ncbi:MAG: riboflavin synthase [Myxococcales bacterium]|nr:riboflavin synthase [Myxococcales bacterium]
MFTGLVETLGRVTAAEARPFGLRLAVEVAWPAAEPPSSTAIVHPGLLQTTRVGDSVAVNGACLTVVAVEHSGAASEVLAFELSHETLARTALAGLCADEAVNLERALRWGDRLGGHLVTGHIDGVGRLCAVTERAGCWDLAYDVPAHLLAEVVRKGSIAIDGISLTVNDVTLTGVLVTIIPHTAAHTQILGRGPGRAVHVETDLVGKHVRRLAEVHLRHGAAGGVSWELLDRSGFLQP